MRLLLLDNYDSFTWNLAHYLEELGAGVEVALNDAVTVDELLERVSREILQPTVRGLRDDGIDYRGVLYAGLMVADDGTPWILEYNCRFGDPETQPVLARLDGDLAHWLAGAAAGSSAA